VAETIHLATAIGQFILAVVIALIALGRWGGGLEARRPRTPGAGTNGGASLGEIARRVEAIDREVPTIHRRITEVAERVSRIEGQLGKPERRG